MNVYQNIHYKMGNCSWDWHVYLKVGGRKDRAREEGLNYLVLESSETGRQFVCHLILLATSKLGPRCPILHMPGVS